VIIGRRGADIDRLRDELQSMTRKEIYVDIKEIATPMADAQLVAENIAFQLEKRVAFRRAMKKAVSQAMSSGAEGIKVICAGRLGGAEIARTEKYKAGKIPLHTLRADVDYGFAEAHTTYGVIGVKCWVYKGDVILGKKNQEELKAADTESEAK
ncbi:MAG: 30S ribosomal protein S3, partial [Candidatus Omnitrophica bacterium]|nr:30S ribosomal protein S3 [Candidatus Omnitrophota bacterium]